MFYYVVFVTAVWCSGGSDVWLQYYISGSCKVMARKYTEISLLREAYDSTVLILCMYLDDLIKYCLNQISLLQMLVYGTIAYEDLLGCSIQLNIA